jgi:hypothetical protein
MPDRKELIRRYKETPRPGGVYRVRNIIGGKSLLGSSPDLQILKEMWFEKLTASGESLYPCSNEASHDGLPERYSGQGGDMHLWDVACEPRFEIIAE